MDQDLAGQVAAVAALDEPTRRRLYDYVARQPAPVSRDDVAAAVDVPRATVAFHLDKLVGEQLLAVTYERRTGRGGPGAGRPTKLYRRSERHVVVSLPERQYELAGSLLAAAIEEANRSGEQPGPVLERRAYREGEKLGDSTKAGQNDGDIPDLVLFALEKHGFEPRTEEADVLLGNCPFHGLARTHTELVCGMNLSLLTGLLSGLGKTGMRAELDPASGRCCVRLTPRTD